MQTQPLTFSARPLTKMAMRHAHLSDKVTEWPKEIMDHLYAEFPSLTDRDVQIAFESKDEKSGHALGKLIIDKKISIPVFISKRMLAPLDTFVFKGKPYRLTDRRLRSVLFKPALFSGVIKPDEEKALSQDEPIYQQTQVNDFREGRRIYASLIDAMLPTFSKGDISKLSSTLEADPQVAANFVLNGHADTISRIINCGGNDETPESIMKSAYAQLPINVVQVRQEGQEAYKVKIASDFGYDPQEIYVPVDKIAATLQTLGMPVESVIRKVAAGEVFTWTSRTAEQTPVYVSAHQKAVGVEKFGAYRVKELGGREFVGRIYPQVYDFDKNATNRMLFVGPEMSLLQEKIAGLPAGDLPNISSDPLITGSVGCFIFEGEGNGLATVPVRIDAVTKQADEAHIYATAMLGKPVLFKLSQIARDIMPMERSSALDVRDIYLLPAFAKFAVLKNGRNKELISDGDLLTKMAIDEVKGDTCTVRGFRGTYTLAGPLVNGVEDSYTELEGSTAVFKLACLGLDAGEADAILDRCDVGEDVTIGGLRKPQTLMSKISAARDKVILPTLAQLPYLKQDTIKLASEIKDPEILDRVLALNFLNPQNLQILLEHQKDLDKTSSKLSELLIASRYGANKDLNEDAIIMARKSIDDVIDGLAQLKSRVGTQTEVE